MMTTYEMVTKQAQAKTCDQDNALVAQKDFILDQVRGGNLLDAARHLRFAAPLWTAMSYGYKVREIKNLIIGEARAAVEALHPNNRTLRRELMTVTHIASSIEA